MEAAVLAAAILQFHGHPPLLMDLQSTNDDYDHVVALFKQNGYWGAISKTGQYVLRWRDPIYRNVRELAMSYFNEYFLPDKGKHFREKTMLTYSKPFNLNRYKVEDWFAAPELDWLANALDKFPHFPCYPKSQKKFLRKAYKIEIQAMKHKEH